MKNMFETPILEVIEFVQEDVIRTSGEGFDTPTEGTGGGGSNNGDLNLPIDPSIGK